MPGSSPRVLRTESQPTALGIDVERPRFSWNLPPAVEEQTAYRIRVTDSPDDFENPLWDSGCVLETDRTLVPYDGPELDTRTRYYWTVCIWDGEENRSRWSDPTWFETGLEEWTGDWIASSPEPEDVTDVEADYAPALRTKFDLDAEPTRARLYVASAGNYECKINDERVGEAVLDTGQTDYEERILYAVHDVTELLAEGTNAIGAVLGRERYAMTTENTWGWHDPPWKAAYPHLCLQLEVELADGSNETVTSGPNWRVTDSPTRFDSLYEGEVYDARETLGAWTTPEYDDSGWDTATVVEGPDGDLVPQQVQPMRIVEIHPPETTTEPVDGIYVFDFGVMTAGWAELAVDVAPGTELELTYGEILHDDGTVDVDQNHIDATIQTDQYICAGEGIERWEPRFTYKGFRYVQVEGLPSDYELDGDLLAAKEIHTTVEAGADSDWQSSNDLLNRIHRNCRRALLNNHHSIPTDTPVYEKNGWTGDAQLTAEMALYNFDMGRFYRKWLSDFADAQRENGEVPPIVPTSDWGYTDSRFEGFEDPIPAWDAAYVLVPWWTYQYCGDRRILATHYEGMKALVDFLGEYAGSGDHADGHILDIGLGDWVAPSHGEIDPFPPEGQGITGTTYYYAMADTVAATAEILGHETDREDYASLAADIPAALNEEFFDPEENVYATGETDEYRQTSNVLPLAFELVPDGHVDGVVENLVADVIGTHDGHLNTGIVGTKYLLPVLTEHDHVDVAYTVATKRDYPSWGHWIEDNATALYEMWDLDARTRDHHMFGSIDEWFYKHLAGVRPAGPGFEAVTVEPYVPEDLDSVQATVDTVRGEISVFWEDGEVFSLEVEVPPATEATVRVPKQRDDLVTPDDAAVVDAGDRWDCTVGTGTWSFVVE